MRKAGGIHFLGRYQNPRTEAGGKGALSLPAWIEVFIMLSREEGGSDVTNSYCFYLVLVYFLNCFFFHLLYACRAIPRNLNDWVFKNKFYHLCLFHWDVGLQSSSCHHSKILPLCSCFFICPSLILDSELLQNRGVSK